MKTKTKKRTAIGENPLDGLLPAARASQASRKGLGQGRPADEPESVQKARGPKKTRTTFHLPDDLVGEARDTVIALSGPPVRLTLARLVEDALRAELARVKKEHNRGRPFPHYEEKLRGGRPVGS